MITIKSKINTLSALEEIITKLSSKEEQLIYKSSVPFVHIPLELMEQLDNQARMLQECAWYFDLFDEKDRDQIVEFYSNCNRKMSMFGDVWPDIPEIFETETWKNIMQDAVDLNSDLTPKIRAIKNNMKS